MKKMLDRESEAGDALLMLHSHPVKVLAYYRC
jgi:hypothetical protein